MELFVQCVVQLPQVYSCMLVAGEVFLQRAQCLPMIVTELKSLFLGALAGNALRPPGRCVWETRTLQGCAFSFGHGSHLPVGLMQIIHYQAMITLNQWCFVVQYTENHKQPVTSDIITKAALATHDCQQLFHRPFVVIRNELQGAELIVCLEIGAIGFSGLLQQPLVGGILCRRYERGTGEQIPHVRTLSFLLGQTAQQLEPVQAVVAASTTWCRRKLSLILDRSQSASYLMYTLLIRSLFIKLRAVELPIARTLSTLITYSFAATHTADITKQELLHIERGDRLINSSGQRAVTCEQLIG
jgi:hypothetical protein